MWMPFWLNNDHVFPRGFQCLSFAWGMNHLGDDSQGQAQDYLGGQPHHYLSWTFAILGCVDFY